MISNERSKRVRMDRLTVLLLVDNDVLIPGTTSFYSDASDLHLANSLRRLANQVVIKPYVNISLLLRSIDEVKPDVVFNYTQQADGDRRKDSYISAVLELQRIPYTG